MDHGLTCGEKVLAETGDRQRVVVKGTAGHADVKSGDEILTVNERQVSNAFDIERAFWGRRPGEQVALKVLRQGRELTVTLTLGDGNGAGPVAATSPPTGSHPTPRRPTRACRRRTTSSRRATRKRRSPRAGTRGLFPRIAGAPIRATIVSMSTFQSLIESTDPAVYDIAHHRRRPRRGSCR